MWNFVPSQTEVDLWQVSQVAVVNIWVADLPVPLTPLWQLAHPVVATTLMWNLAGSQVVVPPLWQVSQLAVVAT